MGVSFGSEKKFRNLEPGLFVIVGKVGIDSARIFTKLEITFFYNAVNQYGRRLRIRRNEKVKKVYLTLTQ